MDWKINHFRLTTMKTVKTAPGSKPTYRHIQLPPAGMVGPDRVMGMSLPVWSWIIRSSPWHQNWWPAQYLLTSRRIVEACDVSGKLVHRRNWMMYSLKQKSLVPEDPEACRPSKWNPYPFDPYLVGLTWQYHFFHRQVMPPSPFQL